MILLITPSAGGLECAATLQDSTGKQTHWAENLQKAVARPREQAVSAVVIDQFLLENEPAESGLVLEHLGTAFPVYLNFAISGERLVRKSVPRYTGASGKKTQAGSAVEQQFRSEMCESLSSMLLSGELAMSVPGVPGPAAEKIRAVDDLAREVRLRLGANRPLPTTAASALRTERRAFTTARSPPRKCFLLSHFLH
jgi:hypothetical protein